MACACEHCEGFLHRTCRARCQAGQAFVNRVACRWLLQLAQLSQALGPAKTTSELLVLYIMLLQDPEAEVRAAACGSLPGYFDLVGSAKFISDVVPCMRDLSVDMALNVRVKLSVVLVDVAAKLGRQASGAHLIQAIMQCLRDEASEVCCLPWHLRLVSRGGWSRSRAFPGSLERPRQPAWFHRRAGHRSGAQQHRPDDHLPEF